MTHSETLDAAVNRGLDFLDAAVGGDGRWLGHRYKNSALTGPPRREQPPFVAALGALALDACRDPRARAVCARTQAWLMECARYPGVWRYRRGLPADLDDTAICSLVCPTHPWVLLGKNVAPVLANRDGEGRFRTWMIPPNWSHESPNDVDSVVNANVIAFLGDRPETRAAQRWVEASVLEGREVDTSPYYCDPADLHFAVARAHSVARPAFDRLKPAIVARMRERLSGGGNGGDAMRTAQALSALDMLGAWQEDATLRQACDALLGAQLPRGAWPECAAWRDPAAVGYASEALTTAYCVEALSRWRRNQIRR